MTIVSQRAEAFVKGIDQTKQHIQAGSFLFNLLLEQVSLMP